MRIAIDCRPLMSGKISGVEVYILEMLRALFHLDRENEYVLFYNNFRAVDLSRWPTDFPNVSVRRTRVPNKILNLALSLLRWPKIDRLIGGRVDVLWVPDPRPAPVSLGVRKIVTFHDLSFEEFRYGFSLKSRLWHRVLRPRREAREAGRIIAVSHFTKSQLAQVYGIAPEKISVIHEAAPPHLKPLPIPKSFELIARKYGLPRQYFLCLSTLEPRKNIEGAVRAFLSWRQDTGHDVALVVAGREYPRIFSGVDLARDPSIVVTGFVDEEDKALLYQHALAFLYPSFYEGFGLPILEAMQCGAPVITSDETAMPEVAGNAALLVNPNDPAQIKNALHSVYRDERLRAELIEKGFRRAAEFSWPKAAGELLQLFTQ